MKRLYYGIKDGQIVSINDVNSGKTCGCVCPSCGEQLIAKKGEIMIHHFAHASTKDCEYGYETSLHLLAKDIIMNSNHFVLPKEKLNLIYYNVNNNEIKNYPSLTDALDIKIDNVEIELSFDNMKPDIVIYSGEKKYFIEIFVTHKIDDAKREKIKNKLVDTIEIDLSNIDKQTEYEALEEILLNDNERKYWIYNNKIETIIEKLQSKCKIPTTMHGFEWHTEYCPRNVREYYGKSYANVTDNCCGCEYCLGVTEQISSEEDSYVICSAAESYRKPIKKEEKALNCPKCSGKLVIRYGTFVRFYGCSNFPRCNYTRKV